MRLITLILPLALVACDVQHSTGAAPSPTLAASAAIAAAEATKAAEEAAETAAFLADCKVTAATRLAKYQKLMAARDYWTATLEIRRCAELLDDPKLKKLVAAGEVKSYVQTIENTKESEYTRERAIDSLQRDYPAIGAKYKNLQATMSTQREQRQRESALRNRFSQRPLLGSRPQDAYGSWGYPDRVNKTINASGTHEQWVYGEGRYLYFDNSVLTSIQDSER